MNEPTIICPSCSHEIKLTESLAEPLVTAVRREFQQKIAANEASMIKREAELQEQLQTIENERKAISNQVREQVEAQRLVIAAEETDKARRLSAVDLEQAKKEVSNLQEVLEQREQKLAEAYKAEAEFVHKERELADRLRELDLTVEKRIQKESITIREQVKKETEAEHSLKIQEREHIISSMQKQIEELRRKAEQGSQQTQGEVLELELEAILRTNFPRDLIEPVPKGQYGGDVVQRVIGPNGQICGSILWESKRTKNWSDSWLPKLREDKRAAEADIAAMVSQTLPKQIEIFGSLDGVCIMEMRCIAPIAALLRQSLIEVAAARRASDGQQTKTEMIYQYLMSSRFRHRIEAIVEMFTAMGKELDRERKFINQQLAKREQQLRVILQSTVGLYGDLQGITGTELPEIKGLEYDTIDSVDDVVTADKLLHAAQNRENVASPASLPEDNSQPR